MVIDPTMQRPLENFLRALRSAKIRISPAESIDAHQTVELVGYHNRQFFKDALCVALAKTPEEVSAYHDVFEMYFKREEFGKQDKAEHGENPENPISAEGDAEFTEQLTNTP